MARAIVIANGPSLTPDDVALCRGKGRVYAVSDAYRLAPWADVCYAADPAWWDHHIGLVPIAEKWTATDSTAEKYGINYAPVTSGLVWSMEFPIASGGNSGFQAVGLAALQGHDEIVLLGFDMGHDPGAPKHWFGDHPKGIDRNSNYSDWLLLWELAAPKIKLSGVSVMNASRETRLDCVPRVKLEDALC